MNKIYVLDTSALIEDPTLIYSFDNSQIVVPYVVLEELDKLKKYQGDVSKNARAAIRMLDEIFSSSEEDNISFGNNSKIKVDFDFEENLLEDMDYGDNEIICCAFKIQKLSNRQVTIVTGDINLRLKAKAFGMSATSYSKSISFLDLFDHMSYSYDYELGIELQNKGSVDDPLGLDTNSFLLFNDNIEKKYALSRKMPNGKLKLLKDLKPWGISPRNKDQACLIELVMDKSVELVSALGIAGSGKTLCALACGLELVLNMKAFDKLIIFRPVQVVGQDIGFLPGSEDEKMAPYFSAIMDSMEILFGSKPTWKKDFEMYINRGKIELDLITFARGRSIPNALIIVDEAQNFSEHEMKTLLTRVGERTKVVLTGDANQIDSRNLNLINNGLTKVIKSFKGSKIFGNVTLMKGERSRLATEAARVLE
jgi:PhoH-like ATPase